MKWQGSIAHALSGGGGRSESLPHVGATMLPRRDIVSAADTDVPPNAFGLGAVFGKDDFKCAFAVIAGLLPGALPATVVETGRRKPPILPGIGTVAVRIERGAIRLIVLDFSDFPFPAQIDTFRDGRLAIGGAME